MTGITDFIGELIKAFTKLPNFNYLFKLMKGEFTKGFDKAESELNLNITPEKNYNPYINALTEEQINGYVLPDGTTWFGIKGVNEDIQNKIHQSITDGLKSNDTVTELKKRVKTIMKTVKDSRAMMIARTESNRIVNQGTNTAYANAGIPGKKEWLTHIDDRTSPICKRLNGQKVNPTDAFVDPKTGEQFWHPPSHPNCFVKDTNIILLPKDKHIQDVKIGDKVLTHKDRFRTVTSTMISEVDEYYELTVGSGKRRRVLKVTGEHPVLTNNGWKIVKDLSVEDWVMSK